MHHPPKPLPIQLDHTFDTTIAGAFIITLKGNALSEALAQRCEHSCQAVGMPYSRWDAVDATSGQITLPPRLQHASWLRWLKVVDPQLSLTEVACALSHISLWAHCLELDRPLVILEHDAVMVGKITQHDFFGAILYLGGREQSQGWSVHSIPPHATKGKNYHAICRAHAYGIDPAAARNLLAHVLRMGIHEALDMMIRTDLFCIVQPGLYAVDKPSPSTITDRK